MCWYSMMNLFVIWTIPDVSVIAVISSNCILWVTVWQNLVEMMGDLHIKRKEVAHSLWRNSSAAWQRSALDMFDFDFTYCIAILLSLVHAQGIMHLRIVKSLLTYFESYDHGQKYLWKNELMGKPVPKTCVRFPSLLCSVVSQGLWLRPVCHLRLFPSISALWANNASQSASWRAIQVFQGYGQRVLWFAFYVLSEEYAAGKHFLTFFFSPRPLLRGRILCFSS